MTNVATQPKYSEYLEVTETPTYNVECLSKSR